MNTAPLSPQVLAALVSQLRTGSKSLLVRTVAVGLGQQCTGKGESVEGTVTWSVEALFAEESLEAKPVGAFAEVLGSFEAPFEVPAPWRSGRPLPGGGAPHHTRLPGWVVSTTRDLGPPAGLA